MTLRFEPKATQLFLAIVLITMMPFSLGFADKTSSLIVPPSVKDLVIGPIQFVEIYFLAGNDSERRSPIVGEEFIVKVEIRNIGPGAIYYFPTLCDSSLSATFDPSYVKVESGRPRCLAASMLTPLSPGEETTVWAPESGNAYLAIRSGSTTVTVIFTFDTGVGMDLSTREAGSTVPLTIEAGPTSCTLPGLPIESLVLGFVIAAGVLLYRRRDRTRQHTWPAHEEPSLTC